MAIKSSNQITFTEHKKIIEIKEWYLATPEREGITTQTTGWTTDIQTIDYTNRYLWNYEEVVYSIGSSEISDPVIIGYYGQGESGRGIVNIVNYYQVTYEANTPEVTGQWFTSAPTLSPTNKYLWNYEIITYTDDSTTTTVPAIIGVYGDSAVVFEIYSTHGTMFKQNLTSLELKIAAFEGSEAITNATYTWEWWNDALNDNAGGYSLIAENTTEQSLVVSSTDEYAFANLKCTMTYNGNVYEDYITLTSETVVYSSAIKFFGGSNIFHSDDLYLIAYIDVYQNGHRVETIAADNYCTGVSSISDDGVITANITGDFHDGNMMYFVCKKDSEYYVVLGSYTNGSWRQIEHVTQYDYTNTLQSTSTSNVIAISKESINKAANLDMIVSYEGIEVTRASANVVDSNDPIVSDIAPENPVYNQLWLDTSTIPSVLKMFIIQDDAVSEDGQPTGQWVNCTERIGGSVFTSRPSSYSQGDLWILANGETCRHTDDNGEVIEEFLAGSMLKAVETSSIFNDAHWVDADEGMTELTYNIKQYLHFDPESGLKIGQKDENFYVNIGATEMGFYDNQGGQAQKVVCISNNSAIIQNAKFKGNTDFYGQINMCNPSADAEDNLDDTLFVWQIESNGSLSLAVPI